MAPGPIPPTPHRPGRRHATFSPSQLRVYRDCPERYFRTYLANERVPPAFSRGTLRGSAVHKSLAEAFRRRQQGELIETVERSVAVRYLPRLAYQKAAAVAHWEEDLTTVLDLVAAGLRAVPEQAKVLEVERSFSHVRSTRSPIAGVTLVGHVDLVVEHPEGMIEQIEFKTGGAEPDDYQDVICRIGVCEAYNARGLPVLSSTIQLTSGDEWALDGDREELVRVLGEIERTVLEIWDATDWPARENSRCRFCNYASTLCSLRGEWSKAGRVDDRPG